MKFLFKLIFTISILSIISCTEDNITTNNILKKYPDSILTKVNDMIDITMDSLKCPGVVIAVWQQGYEPLIITKGMADIGGGNEMSTSKKFRIGSITKTFLVTAFLQLVEEGKLNLNDKLEKYYPELHNSDTITIRHLCNNTSGLFDYLNDSTMGYHFWEDRLSKFTPQELIDISQKYPSLFLPGEKWSYSNTNFIIIGMLIEKLTGNRVEDEITNRVINKLNLNNTYFPTTPNIEEEHIHGYSNAKDWNSWEDVTLIDPSIPWTAGAIISTVVELRIWAEALVNGTLLTKKMQEERLDFFPLGHGLDKGYGLGIMREGPFIGHTGGITGYSTFCYHSPELKTTAVSIGNRYNKPEHRGPMNHLVYEVLEVIFNNPGMF